MDTDGIYYSPNRKARIMIIRRLSLCVFCVGILLCLILMAKLSGTPSEENRYYERREYKFLQGGGINRGPRDKAVPDLNVENAYHDLHDGDSEEQDMPIGDENYNIDHGKEPHIKDEVARNHLKSTFIPSSNCTVLLTEDRLVRNCITGNVIGRVTKHTETRRLRTPQRDSPETGSERRASFSQVFSKRAWGHSWDPNYKELNASGRGATLQWTQELSATLHIIISQIKQQLGKTRMKILDVPCGDMAWMSRFLQTRDDVDYTGMDIVPDLIKHHQKTYRNPSWRFIVSDMVSHDLVADGGYDLVVCRTLLQHLYDMDAMRVLARLSSSASHYLLATTFASQDANFELEIDDTNPGRMRRVNLEVPPVSLTPPLCLQRDGPPDDHEGWDHFVGLWKLPLHQVHNCERGKEFKLMGTDRTVYSCVEWSPYIDLN